MRRERGLSEATIRGCCMVVDQFFVWLADSRILLASVSITDIDQIIAAWNARKDYSRNTIKLNAGASSQFFPICRRPGLVYAGDGHGDPASEGIHGRASPSGTASGGCSAPAGDHRR